MTHVQLVLINNASKKLTLIPSLCAIGNARKHAPINITPKKDKPIIAIGCNFIFLN